ncbi:MAG: hypothetical protein M0Z76_07875 [Gammaproteobacteria bacterium]|nr:hypothetical protein [Gammaproteobacteria bacterium]
MRNPDDLAGTVSARAARAEAERHRRDLSQTITQLSDRITGAIGDVEQQVTLPVRWARAHPLAALGIGLAAGFLLSQHKRQAPRRAMAPSRELEGAYLVGRRDESEHRPARDPAYWSGGTPPPRASMGLGGLFWTLAQPLLHELAEGLGTRARTDPRD